MRKTALFALSSGCFSAGLVGTPVALVDLSVGPLSTGLLAGLVAVCAGVGGAAAMAMVSPDTVRRIQSRRRMQLYGFGIPAIYLTATVVVGFLGPGFRSEPLVFGLAGTALTLAGAVGMVDASQSLYAEGVVANSDCYVPLPNTKTDRQRRIERWVGGVSLLALAVLVGYTLLSEGSIPIYLYIIFLPGIAQLLFASGREQALVDAGFKRGNSVLPWEEFEGYERSETYLTLTRPGRSTGIQLRRDRFDDEQAVLSALARIFPDAGERAETDEGSETEPDPSVADAVE